MKKYKFAIIGGFIIILILICSIFLYTKNVEQNKNNKTRENLDYATHIIEYDNIFEILSVSSITESFLIKEYEADLNSLIFVKENNIYKKNDKILQDNSQDIVLDITIGYVSNIEKNDSKIKITFIDMTKLKTEAFIPIEKSNEVNEKLEVSTISFGTRMKYDAKISYIDYKFTEIDGKYFRKIEIIIDNNQNYPLLINNPIELNIKIKEIKGILVIPETYISYIYESEGQKIGVVFIKKDDKIIETSVYLGLKFLDKYEIKKGLEKDDVVILK